MPLEVLTRRPETATLRPTPLLFIHGAWHGAWCWEVFFMPYFASKGYACYALSLRGHGKSDNDKSLRWTGIRDYVADVLQVTAQIEAETGVRPVVIGHSMGGYVVQKYLEKYTTPAAVLLASIPSGGILPFVFRMTRHYPVQMLKIFTQLRGYPLVATPELAKKHFFSDEVPLETVNEYHKQIQDESFLITLEASMLNLPRPGKVRAKNIPMLVIGAVDDNVFTVREEQNTAKAYGTRAEIFPNLAHDVMLEPRWQAVADRILDWLDERGL